MFEDGLIVRVKGIPFCENEYTDFPLLKDNPNNKKQSTIIYGRNGSGKTSLTKALNELKKEESLRVYDITLCDKQGNLINIDCNDMLYIFNEEFIDNQVKFKPKGLDTIVLLGDDVVDQKRIDELKQAIKDNEIELSTLNLDIFKNSKHTDNPNFYMERMVKTLRQDGNWADRQRTIKKISKKDVVNEQVVLGLKKYRFKKTTPEEYNKELTDYLKVESNEHFEKVFILPNTQFSEEKFYELLEKRLDFGSHDELSTKIYETIKEYSEIRSNEIVDKFSSEIAYCPYCFRPIGFDEKQIIIDKIKSVLSKDSEELICEINKLMLNPYNQEELPGFINSDLIAEYEYAVKNYNSVVNDINNLLEKKKLNLYVPLDIPNDINYHISSVSLEDSINKINVEIAQYNTIVDNKKEIKEKLFEYNSYFSWQTIKDDYALYEEKISYKKEIEEKYDKLSNQIENDKQELNLLVAHKRNIEDACKEINEILAFIFFDKNRLSIELADDQYIVKSKGKSVELNKLSTGERNIIALCYFFCTIGQGKQVSTRHKDEYLIIIDDPISSFDHNNRIGIYSFLRKKINQFTNSNFIILTHNYEVAFNIAKVFSDVYEKDKGKHITNYMEMANLKIIKNLINLKDGKSQYNLLFNEIYKYANREESELNNLTIGNSIRRLLEMFSTFEYCIPSERLIDKINGNSSVESFLKEYMYRILVNNESHTKIIGYLPDDMNQFDMYDEEEKIRTSKIVLLLVLTLNPEHIKSYLPEDKIQNIINWKDELESTLTYKEEDSDEQK